MNLDLTSTLKLAMIAALSQSIVCLSACKHPEGANVQREIGAYLEFLERGKAGGELSLTTDGSAQVYAQQSFGIGPANSTLSFNGRIDFGTHKVSQTTTTQVNDAPTVTIVSPTRVSPN